VGITLHSYRYAWAQRAKKGGFPERYAMMALGQSSKAVHEAYAGTSEVTIPALEEYAKQGPPGKIVPFKGNDATPPKDDVAAVN
jgi:integrase